MPVPRLVLSWGVFPNLAQAGSTNAYAHPSSCPLLGASTLFRPFAKRAGPRLKKSRRELVPTNASAAGATGGIIYKDSGR
jgi:hypothetical protein